MKKTKGLVLLSIVLCLSLLLPCLNFEVKAAEDTTTTLNYLVGGVIANGETFTLTTGSRFFIVSAAEPDAELVRVIRLASSQFAEKEVPSTETLAIEYGAEWLAKDGDILIYTTTSLAADAYKLEVGARTKVYASNMRGFIYGLNTLLKYFISEGGNTLSGFTVTDIPETKDRIFMLDCARKYYTKDWICNLIREMSWMGYNTLELHFTEDGGMRLNIWDDSEVFTSNNGNNFSWLMGGEGAYWVDVEDPDEDKYLGVNDLIAILDVAKQYCIDVIPAFDTPYHSEHMCKKYEAYATTNPNETFRFNGVDYRYGALTNINYNKNGTSASRYNCVNIPDDQARAFVYAVMEDYADFFKAKIGSTDFNIGADEVALSNAIGWDTFAQEKGVGTTAYDTFIWFVNEVYELLSAKGYNVRAYCDFLERGDYTCSQELNGDIEIVYWTEDYNYNNFSTPHIKPASEFASDRRTIYTGIETFCYYVLRRDTKDGVVHDARDPQYFDYQFQQATAENIWNYWKPSVVSKAESKNTVGQNMVCLAANQVEGAYYMLWGDEAGISTEAQIWNGVDNTGKWNIIERMWANSTKMWTWDANSSVSDVNTMLTLADELGDAPGIDNCSTAVTLATSKALTLATPEPENGAYTIKVNNALEGQTYTAYRLFDLTIDNSGDEPLYLYTVNERWEEFFESGAVGLNYVTISADGYISWNSNADPARLARDAKAYAEEYSIYPVATATATGNPPVATLTGVDAGYYLVTSSAGTIASLDTTEAGTSDAGTNVVVINEKNSPPTLDKKLKDEETDTAYTDGPNSAAIGDTVYYSVDITVGAGAIGYVLTDTMGDGLTYVDNSVSVEYGPSEGTKTSATQNTDYVLTVEGQVFTVAFTDAFLAARTVGDIITVYCRATVNENALIREPNLNTAKLTWSNQYLEDYVETLVYDFSYTKVNSAGASLSGAEFTLWDAQTDGNNIPVVFVREEVVEEIRYNVYRKALANETGVQMTGAYVIVQGFDSEDFNSLYLHEIEAPAGFNIPSTRFKVDGTNVTTARPETQIINNSGLELPSTGGIGTAAFIFVGAMLMLAATVLFSAEKKMSVL